MPREFNGVKGERLRTIKLRGQVSQGLLLSLIVLDAKSNRAVNPEDSSDVVWFGENDTSVSLVEGYDCTELLGIQKWEAPLSAQLAGKAKGNFPSFIPKTDQERIQNCFGEIQKKAKRFQTEKVWNAETQVLEEHPVVVPADFKEPTYEVTMKLDGSSMTIFRLDGELRVCSRNLELKIDEENKDNSFVAMALKIGDAIPEGLAFQGELMGPGIQNNREGLKDFRFFVFDIFDIVKYEYFDPHSRVITCDSLKLDHVPIIAENLIAPESVDAGLALAEGPSINHKIREGLVWKCNEDPSFSFKTISNAFLLKSES